MSVSVMPSLCNGRPGDDLDGRIDLLTHFIFEETDATVGWHKQGYCNLVETKFGDTVPTCSPVTIHKQHIRLQVSMSNAAFVQWSAR